MHQRPLSSLISCLLLSSTFISACADDKPQSLKTLSQDQATASSANHNSGLSPHNPIATQDTPIGKLPALATPLFYDVTMKVNPRETSFSGQVDMKVDLVHASDGIWIHGDDIRVKTVTVNGDAAQYEEVLPTGVSRLSFTKTYPAGPVDISIDYEADFDVNLAGLFRVEEQGEAYALAKSESIQARRFLPGFDEPGYKAPFDITLIIPKGDEAISNTPIKARETLTNDPNFEKVEFETTRPLSTYLLSVAVGPFDVVTYPDIPPNSVRTTPLPLRGFARKGRGDDLKASLDITAPMLEVFEEALKLPYPYKKLDLIAAPQWPSGATELAGAITYRESRLLLDENSGPAAYRSMLGIHSHEIAHMWFGNLVTPPWWDDLWLKEAFATWGTPLALTALEPDNGHDIDSTVRALGAMGLDSLASTRAVREPILRNENIRNAYDGITYSKGMAVISMVDNYFGADVFRPALGVYLKAFEDIDADSPDFYQAIGEATKTPALTEVFRSFIEQKGVPFIDITQSGSNELQLSQSRYRPLGSEIKDGTRWAIPVCIKQGHESENSERICDIMRDSTFKISTNGGSYIMPNAGGSGYYRWNLPTALWEDLIENFDDLTPSEALSAIDSASAAFRSGNLSAKIVLDLLKAASTSSDRRVVAAPMAVLGQFNGLLDQGEARDKLNAFTQDLYAPIYARLLEGSGDSDIVLKNRIESFLAFTANDPKVRAKLREDAGKFIGLNGPRQASALGSDRYRTALTIGVQDGGEAFFDKLLSTYTEIDDPVFAGIVPGALASTRDKALSQKVLSLALSGELGPRETYALVQGQMGSGATRETTWEWLNTNYSQFVSNIPAQWPRRTPGLAGNFCTKDAINDLKSLFDKVGDQAPGYERALAQTSENISLCAALREEQSEKLQAALLKY